MGNKVVKGAGAMKPKDLARYTDTGFNADEIQALYAQFMSLKATEGGEPVLSLAEFQAALGFKGGESLFLQRVFKLMDENHDNLLTFDEFIKGVAVFSPNSTEKKYKFTFSLYDADRKGRITPSDLKVMLTAVTRENGVALTDGQVDRLVLETFKAYDVNHDGAIDYNEYRDMCAQNPALLKPLTINVAEVIAAASGAASPAPGAAAAAGGRR